jgi:acyl-CoA reductase-like NAD-dependent aldehyde dehydrogenase
MKFQTINPATGEVVATYEPASPEARQTTIAGTHQAYLAWRHPGNPGSLREQTNRGEYHGNDSR